MERIFDHQHLLELSWKKQYVSPQKEEEKNVYLNYWYQTIINKLKNINLCIWFSFQPYRKWFRWKDNYTSINWHLMRNKYDIHSIQTSSYWLFNSALGAFIFLLSCSMLLRIFHRSYLPGWVLRIISVWGICW